MRRLFVSFSLIALCSSAAFAEPMQSPRPSGKTASVDYGRDVLPILAGACFSCHGPDQQKGGLRLDKAEFAINKTKSGDIAVVPGQPEKSEAIRRIFSKEADEAMPPPKSNKTLSAAEKETLKKWVAEGGAYKIHWAFAKPVRYPAPAVRDQAWVRNEIDAFVLDRIEKAGLRPSGPADRPALIRRLSLDLRGLPPTVQEVDAFLNDTSADAYEKLVDRMLASPRFGEKMALLWMDLARFGDTSGFHFDSYRQMWVWRDWVIDAFNKNLPFDQFTTWQLAGDLLPNATQEQKVASGFNRNTRFNEEGGADPEEFVIRYNVDRTNTLGQVWLGLTLGCAECHSHKSDPISQKEYYQLYAFFTGINEPMVSGNHNQPLPPLLKMPTAEQKANLEAWRKRQTELDKIIPDAVAKAAYKDPLDGSKEPIVLRTQRDDLIWVDDETPQGASLDSGPFPWVEAPHPIASGKKAMRRSGPGVHQHYFTKAAKPLVVQKGDKLFSHVWLDPKDPPKTVMLQFNDGSWEHRAYWGEDKAFLGGSPNGPNHFHAGPLPKLGEWVRLEIDADKVGLAPGAAINGMAFTQADGTVLYDKAGIQTVTPDNRGIESQRVWELLSKEDKQLPADVQNALKAEPAKRTPAQNEQLRAHYVRKVWQGAKNPIAALEREKDDLAKKVKETEEAIPHTLVSEEMPTPRPAYVLIRGDFLQKGEKVDRGVPSIFPPLPAGAPKNRLGLAQWLVSPDHPLTSRVVANRLWAQMFGTGLVKTAGDFGASGEYPSHPELLDWLATEFVRTGWDVKGMLRKIALSSTYRQSSSFANGVAKIDPYNRLLYRTPRFRLTAEEVRDNALAVSGLLSDKIGGPSVKPYQPGDFYKGKYEAWQWVPSVGEDQYRRGMYTFWRRTSLHPMFAIFDAPSREECVVARPRTNTPLQALVTLNDPTFVEAARVFGQKIMTEGPADLDGRIVYGFRRATARRPSDAEREAIKRRYASNLEKFKADKEGATRLASTGSFARPANLDVVEHAAWTSIANILLNLDETLTRE